MTHLPHRPHDRHPRAGRQAPARAACLALIGGLLVLGCAPAPRPPLPDAVTAVDALEVRAERIASTQRVALVAASVCEDACGLWGPRELVLGHGSARCVCRGAPSLGRKVLR